MPAKPVVGEQLVVDVTLLRERFLPVRLSKPIEKRFEGIEAQLALEMRGGVTGSRAIFGGMGKAQRALPFTVPVLSGSVEVFAVGELHAVRRIHRSPRGSCHRLRRYW